MGRQKKDITAAPAQDGFDQQKLEEAGQAAQQISVIHQNYNHNRDLINQLLGQAQAFNAASDLLRTFGVAKLKIVKEKGLYKGLAGQRTPNGSELSGTWSDFCSLLGISDDKANEDIKNFEAFGAEALEQMQRVGVGYRDLRQLRKLPADQRTALIEAAKDGDKDTLLELAEDLIAKHTKEKTELEEKLANERTRLEVEEDSNKKAKEENTKLKLQLKKKIVANTDWPDALIPLTDQIAGCKRDIDHAFSKLETARMEAINVLNALDEEERPKYEAALRHVAEVYGSALESAERHYNKDLVVFSQTLGAFLED